MCTSLKFLEASKPTCLAVFWPRTPASPLADLMTEGTWLRRKATQENIRTKKGLLESTGNVSAQRHPSPRKQRARAVPLLALSKQGLETSEPVNKGLNHASTPPTGQLKGRVWANAKLSPRPNPGTWFLLGKLNPVGLCVCE